MTINFMKNERLKQHLNDFLQFLESFKQEKETLPVDDPDKAFLALTVLQRQHQQRLKQRIAKFHAADIAHILDTLPLGERLSVWTHIPQEAAGEILLELSDPVRESLLAEMDVQEMVSATEMLDTDEIADLVPDLPTTVVEQILTSLSDNDRKQLEEVLSYEEGTVGALMDFGMLTVREENSIDTVLRYFRKLSQLPEYTNQIFVVDRDNVLQGHVLLQDLVTFPFKSLIGEVMIRSKVSFKTEDDAREATQAFDRYELISAAVVDDDNKLIGRICVDDILDFVRESTENEVLAQAGFMEGEDLFSGMWKGAKNRWLWLSVNLITAFIATRVIGFFEDTILQVVALAALMPIVAAAGGNSG
ncbi:MAG: magnesium transporter, partial [Methylococcales bacterium]|nr:magnesium transporter [Methylococcales bacterium]